MNHSTARERIFLLIWTLAFCLLATAATDASQCGRTEVGLTPLSDLGPASYAGFEGGLYAGGASVRPESHERAGLFHGARVLPRSPQGAISTNGQIGVLTVGMSNTRSESDAFVTACQADPRRAGAVVPVNGAEGGASANVIQDPAHAYWSRLIARVRNAGLTPEQIQVIWYKDVDISPTLPFPEHAQKLQGEHTAIVQNLARLFPNLRQCYLSSRVYAGYASTTLNPEPYAYESAFACKWLIDAQIQGDPALNHDPRQGPVTAPWLSWGPYLWADGLQARSDGLQWICPDFASDGTHPSLQGARKVADALLAFFQTDTTTRGWYLASQSTDAPMIEVPTGARIASARPNPFRSSLAVPLDLDHAQPVRAHIYTADGRRIRELANRSFPAGTTTLRWDGRDDAGRTIPAGIYFLRVQAGSATRTVKVTRTL